VRADPLQQLARLALARLLLLVEGNERFPKAISHEEEEEITTMKKLLGVALVAVLVLGVSGIAMARWGGPMMGYGPQGGGPGGPGAGFGPGGRPCWNQGGAPAQPAAIDEAKAKQIATEYVAKNLPGYQVEKLVKFDRPRGAMYQVEVKGPKDEIQYLHINPFGYVRTFGAGKAF
jgi:hypothetical protein